MILLANSVSASPSTTFTPSDYVAVTVTLTGSAFHLNKQIKGATRQRYGHRYIIARCEWTFTTIVIQNQMLLTIVILDSAVIFRRDSIPVGFVPLANQS